MRFLGSRDCYSTPADVYRVAKARGMDLVAFTDHDSIDGALELLNQPAGRSTTSSSARKCRAGCRTRGIEVHLGVYGMTEALHRDLQPLRGNVVRRDRAAARGRRVLRAQSPAAFLPRPDSARALPAAARRGAGARGAQRHDARRAQRAHRADRRRGSRRGRYAMVAGSDAHTLRRIGRTWTEAPGRTRDEFMQSLRARPRPARRRARHRPRRSPATRTASSRAMSRRSPASGRATSARRSARRASRSPPCRCRCSSCLSSWPRRSKAGERRAIAALTGHLARAKR